MLPLSNMVIGGNGSNVDRQRPPTERQGVSSGSQPAKRKIGGRSGDIIAGRAISALDTVP
jgi:hypothetical protein